MMGGMMQNSGNTGMSGMMSNVDRHFIEMMVPHHQDAIDMANLALQKATRPEIKTLAENIKRTQTLEIAQMRTWYKSWYGVDLPVSQTGSNDSSSSGMMGSGNNSGMMGGMSMMGAGAGNMSMDDMDMGKGMNLSDLANAKDFDKAFIEAMVPHHQMAVMMSGMVLGYGEKPELRSLVQSIITAQTGEIDQMRTWYKQWYNTTP